jgi:hypothetical protein
VMTTDGTGMNRDTSNTTQDRIHHRPLWRQLLRLNLPTRSGTGCKQTITRIPWQAGDRRGRCGKGCWWRLKNDVS